MSDPLSIAAIGTRQQEVEKDIQGVPQAQLDSDRAVIEAEREHIKAQAKASAEWQTKVASESRKPLAAERDLFIFEKTEDEWYKKRDAEIQADYARALAKALYAESISLQSRMKGALEADRMHVRVGQG